MKSQVGNYTKGELTMFATVARFCVTRRRWVLAAWMLLLVIGLAAVVPLWGALKAGKRAGHQPIERRMARNDLA